MFTARPTEHIPTSVLRAECEEALASGDLPHAHFTLSLAGYPSDLKLRYDIATLQARIAGYGMARAMLRMGEGYEGKEAELASLAEAQVRDRDSLNALLADAYAGHRDDGTAAVHLASPNAPCEEAFRKADSYASLAAQEAEAARAEAAAAAARAEDAWREAAAAREAARAAAREARVTEEAAAAAWQVSLAAWEARRIARERVRSVNPDGRMERHMNIEPLVRLGPHELFMEKAAPTRIVEQSNGSTVIQYEILVTENGLWGRTTDDGLCPACNAVTRRYLKGDSQCANCLTTYPLSAEEEGAYSTE